MLTVMQLRALKPGKKIYKVADQQGLYVAVMPSGGMSFRYDYRVSGRRETLVIGRYDSQVASRKLREADQLSFGMWVSLAEARLLLAQARRQIQQGNSPSRSKVEQRVQANDAFTFGNWAEKHFTEAALAGAVTV